MRHCQLSEHGVICEGIALAFTYNVPDMTE
jgi:hypothetical protein